MKTVTKMVCDKCKSQDTIKMGKQQASGRLIQKYYCKKCLHFFYP